MSSDIWTECEGHDRVELKETIHRSVVSKAINSTMKFVDNEAEHKALEELLDGSKPPCPLGPHHHVIRSAFRYKYPKTLSRFGDGIPIFYGSLSREACFAERAYYIFRFKMDSESLSEKTLYTPFTMFSVEAYDPQAVDLKSPPFDQHIEYIASPVSYRWTHKLGKQMKEDGVRSFLFPSARGSDHTHVGIFDIDVIQSHTPNNEILYEAYCGSRQMTILSAMAGEETRSFQIDDYLVDGKFPRPS